MPLILEAGKDVNHLANWLLENDHLALYLMLSAIRRHGYSTDELKKALALYILSK